jgi:multicomponent Na+:H+ antiporter subunit D
MADATAGAAVTSALPILLLIPLLLGAVLALLAGLWRSAAAQATAVAATGTTLVLALYGLVRTVADGPLTHDMGGWAPPVGIVYVLDPLAAYMAAIVALIGLLVSAYPTVTAFALRPGRGVPLYPLVLLLLSGLMGVVLTGDLFHLFVFIEIYALATYPLVSLGGTKGVFAALRYLLLGTIGSGLYLLGVGFLYFSTGTLTMADTAAALPAIGDNPAVLGALALIVLGLGLKMALFPLHVWLPDAHSAAPPGVAALLAAVQVKVGAYALVRIIFDVFGPTYAAEGGLPVMTALVWFGAAGIVFGSVLAIRQPDIKRLLAYSTVAQLGYIGVGIGLASPLALVAALLHVLNHALMKSGLFLMVGGVLDRTGLKEIARYSGLGRRMPLTMAGFAVLALSMVGIPPLAGFWSKWYLVIASLDAGQWPLAVVVGGSSLLTAYYFLRVFERVFVLAPTEPIVAEAVEPRAAIVVPVLVLAGLVIAVGLTQGLLVAEVLLPIAERLLG